MSWATWWLSEWRTRGSVQTFYFAQACTTVAPRSPQGPAFTMTPMQLQDILYSQGFGTRRICAGLIQQGYVQVDLGFGLED